jgi:hypothetical protein
MSAAQPDFPPLEHSVYLGRERLGRYSRIGPKLYAAFDTDDVSLGEFTQRKAAYAAVSTAQLAKNIGSRPNKKIRRRR